MGRDRRELLHREVAAEAFAVPCREAFHEEGCAATVAMRADNAVRGEASNGAAVRVRDVRALWRTSPMTYEPLGARALERQRPARLVHTAEHCSHS